jgi:hypothetical protein
VADVFARLTEALADRYALDRKLGEGGMARRRARDRGVRRELVRGASGEGEGGGEVGPSEA